MALLASGGRFCTRRDAGFHTLKNKYTCAVSFAAREYLRLNKLVHHGTQNKIVTV